MLFPINLQCQYPHISNFLLCKGLLGDSKSVSLVSSLASMLTSPCLNCHCFLTLDIGEDSFLQLLPFLLLPFFPLPSLPRSVLVILNYVAFHIIFRITLILQKIIFGLFSRIISTCILIWGRYAKMIYIFQSGYCVFLSMFFFENVMVIYFYLSLL